jgi:hypothetical protein
MMRMLKAILSVAGLFFIVPSVVLAGGNLVTNGNFTDTNPSTWTNNLSLDTTITATGWNKLGPNVYLAMDASQNTAVWGPGNGVANGLTTSPTGGPLVMIDGGPSFRSGVEQTVGGLTVGHTYSLSFYDAAAQQYGTDGPTTSYMQVNFGTDTQYTSAYSIGDQGFSGWNLETMSFTATSTSQLLQFLAVGNVDLPPYMLVSGISLMDTTVVPVPEPSTVTMMAFSLAGMGAFVLRRRALAKASA